MKITNNFNLPQSVVSAVENDPYDKGDSDYTCTELISPIRQVMLRHRHEDELTEDASERVWSLLGQAVHHILERSEQDDALVEERIGVTVEGRKISGQADLYTEKDGGTISDYKVTSAWTTVYGSRTEEWEQQLNILAYLFRVAGFAVNKLSIVVFYRDWSASKAKADANYPRMMVAEIPVELWDVDDQVAFIHDKVKQFAISENTPDADLPYCNPEERWEKPTVYAVMREGRKSSIRNCDSMEAAEKIKQAEKKQAGLYVEIRYGEWTRCESYCSAAPFCNQYQEYVNQN